MADCQEWLCRRAAAFAETGNRPITNSMEAKSAIDRLVRMRSRFPSTWNSSNYPQLLRNLEECHDRAEYCGAVPGPRPRPRARERPAAAAGAGGATEEQDPFNIPFSSADEKRRPSSRPRTVAAARPGKSECSLEGDVECVPNAEFDVFDQKTGQPRTWLLEPCPDLDYKLLSQEKFFIPVRLTAANNQRFNTDFQWSENTQETLRYLSEYLAGFARTAAQQRFEVGLAREDSKQPLPPGIIPGALIIGSDKPFKISFERWWEYFGIPRDAEGRTIVDRPSNWPAYIVHGRYPFPAGVLYIDDSSNTILFDQDEGQSQLIRVRETKLDRSGNVISNLVCYSRNEFEQDPNVPRYLKDSARVNKGKQQRYWTTRKTLLAEPEVPTDRVLQEELDRLKQELKTKDNQLRNVQQDLSVARGRVSNVPAETAFLRQQNIDLKAANERCGSENIQLKSFVEELKVKGTQALQELDRRCAVDIQSLNQQRNNDRQQFTETIAGLQRELAQVRDQLRRRPDVTIQQAASVLRRR